MENCTAASKILLEQLNIKFTKRYLEDNILSHPDHPSLLAIVETLAKYDIDSLALKVDQRKLKNLPLPAIIQVKTDREYKFQVLVDFSNNVVIYLNDRNKRVKKSIDEFNQIWTGVCLLVEKSGDFTEVGIRQKLVEKRILNTLKISIALLFVVWAATELFDAQIAWDLPTTLNVIVYTILKALGLSVGILLLWFEIDQFNPRLQNFCSGGKKVNCYSVLNSKYAQVFNGFLSLSLISFSYFFSSLVYLILMGFSNFSLSLVTIFSFAALPFIIMSLYYQALVIKQWCKFCIAIQIVLVLEILLSYLGGFYESKINIETLPLFFALIFVPVLVWKFIKPLLEKEKQLNLYKRGLKKIKNNPDVFQSLLMKSRMVKSSPEGLGIWIESEEAKYNILKVCNPYCGPCAKSHLVLDELIADGKINLQILFSANLESDDPSIEPVRHFMALDGSIEQNEMQVALEEWYSSAQKDYLSFAHKYPLNGRLNQQDGKIRDMNLWCITENITYTPTIFINGRELPKEYGVEDLKEVLI